MYIKYGKREHRGSLEDSLKTKKTISEKTFQKLLKNYNYYCYDSRCNQILFINTKLQYTWLYMEIINETN